MRARLATWSLLLGAGIASAQTPPPVDPAALRQLIDAVSLDVMSEASLAACEDVGAPAFEPMREAWAAWRAKHQLAPLRTVVKDMARRQGRSAPSWDRITEPMRERVLNDPAPDAACAALARDWQTAGMDATALYPQAGAAAIAVVQARLASPLTPPPVFTAPVQGQFLLPSQIDALAAQHPGGWSGLSDEAAERLHGWFFIKGRVARWPTDDSRFSLIQDQGDRIASTRVTLAFNAEAWVGREIVVRGLLTSLRSYSVTLSHVAVVADASGLAPSPLAKQALARKPVMLRRVLSPPGAGLPPKDLAAVVIYGQANYNNGSSWEEDVRFLLRDGSVYNRTSMPPDQLNVAASRRLEPHAWGHWRQAATGYEMQWQDADGRPLGDWRQEKHHAVKPWPQDTRLDGYFSRATFSGSLALGGVSATTGMLFTRDGRFERSHSSFAGSGGMAAMNGAVVSASSQRDGKGSSSTAGGTAGGAGAFSSSKADDGAGRRGRYQLSGYVLTLDYDDGHQERLLCFPVNDDGKTVYVGSGSLSLAK